jgi:signal transduction histidine kinase
MSPQDVFSLVFKMNETQKTPSGQRILQALSDLRDIAAFCPETPLVWQKWQEYLKKELNVPRVFLFLTDDESTRLSLEKIRDLLGDSCETDPLSVSLSESSLLVSIFRQKNFVWAERPELGDPIFDLWEKEAGPVFLGVSLIVRGRPVGVLLLALRPGATSDENARALFEAVAGALVSFAADLVSLRQQADQIENFKRQEGLLKKIHDEMRQKQTALETATHVIEKDSEEMQKLLQLKTDFISAVSHELRTPLTSIKESISLIQEEAAGPLTEHQKKFLGIAIKNIDRLSRLINDMLDFSRIEAGKLKLDRKITRLEPLIGDVARTLNLEIARKKLEFKIDIPEKIPEVYVDSDRLIQVILNLLSNAVKFTPDGGQVTVEVKIVDDFPGFSEIRDFYAAGQRFIEISVIDTGVGIKEEDLHKLFQKFEQIESGLGRHYNGVGLGLVISKELIELHDGRIWAESRYKNGSSFHFVIPLKGLPKVLVVDDEQSIVSSINALLQSQGYLVLGANDGEEALEKIRREIPDLIILDLKMPRLDGYQVVRHLKKEEAYKKIPILILSGYTVDTGILKAFGLSKINSIAKPFEADDLINEIDILMGKG